MGAGEEVDKLRMEEVIKEEVRSPSLPEEAVEILDLLASKWESEKEDGEIIEEGGSVCREWRVMRLSGAMTNQVYEVHWSRKGNNGDHRRRKVLVRVYGEGVKLFFDRALELQTFEFMSKHGQGPRLLARFSNGRVEEFIHAATLTAHDLHDPKISGLIAAKMREFHDLNMPAVKKAMIWDRLRVWLKAAKDKATPEEASEFRLDRLGEEINTLEKTLSEGNQRIGFCHNDLQYGNIMIDNENDTVTMIDYEYASFNPVAFDIGNHFCEMAANYHTKTPHVLDFGKYPGYNRRKEFVLAYLRSSGDEANEEEAEQLMDDIEKFTIVSHLLWTLWGIISEHVNNIDFKYIEYARQRFEQYRKKMEILDHNAFVA